MLAKQINCQIPLFHVPVKGWWPVQASPGMAISGDELGKRPLPSDVALSKWVELRLGSDSGQTVTCAPCMPALIITITILIMTITIIITIATIIIVKAWFVPRSDGYVCGLHARATTGPATSSTAETQLNRQELRWRPLYNTASTGLHFFCY